MLIKTLKINYYKSIKHPLILDLPLINIFIGQNNSGKSNILDAIEFALGGDLNNEQIYYAQADIEMILSFSDDEVKRHQFPDASGHFIFRDQARKLLFGTKEIPYNKSLAIILSSKLKRLDELSFFDLKQIELDWQSLHKYPASLEKFKNHLKHHFPKISASENALDINYQHDGLYEGDRRVTIDRLGSGFLRIFAILLYIFHPSYSVVMIDEPETHLHPAMIDKLNWAMQNAEAGQVIFTTHSPLFITPVSLPQLFRVTKEANTTKVFSLSKAHYNYQRLVQELNADNLEMFFADEV
ncbi:MAG: AAA family ATPase, partial [bacterium]|nr:AAA family ATPase [bacterium]